MEACQTFAELGFADFGHFGSVAGGFGEFVGWDLVLVEGVGGCVGEVLWGALVGATGWEEFSRDGKGAFLLFEVGHVGLVGLGDVDIVR